MHYALQFSQTNSKFSYKKKWVMAVRCCMKHMQKRLKLPFCSRCRYNDANAGTDHTESSAWPVDGGRPSSHRQSEAKSAVVRQW